MIRQISIIVFLAVMCNSNVIQASSCTTSGTDFSCGELGSGSDYDSGYFYAKSNHKATCYDNYSIADCARKDKSCSDKDRKNICGEYATGCKKMTYACGPLGLKTCNTYKCYCGSNNIHYDSSTTEVTCGNDYCNSEMNCGAGAGYGSVMQCADNASGLSLLSCNCYDGTVKINLKDSVEDCLDDRCLNSQSPLCGNSDGNSEVYGACVQKEETGKKRRVVCTVSDNGYRWNGLYHGEKVDDGGEPAIEDASYKACDYNDIEIHGECVNPCLPGICGVEVDGEISCETIRDSTYNKPKAFCDLNPAYTGKYYTEISFNPQVYKLNFKKDQASNNNFNYLLLPRFYAGIQQKPIDLLFLSPDKDYLREYIIDYDDYTFTYPTNRVFINPCWQAVQDDSTVTTLKQLEEKKNAKCIVNHIEAELSDDGKTLIADERVEAEWVCEPAYEKNLAGECKTMCELRNVFCGWDIGDENNDGKEEAGYCEYENGDPVRGLNDYINPINFTPTFTTLSYTLAYQTTVSTVSTSGMDTDDIFLSFKDEPVCACHDGFIRDYKTGICITPCQEYGGISCGGDEKGICRNVRGEDGEAVAACACKRGYRPHTKLDEETGDMIPVCVPDCYFKSSMKDDYTELTENGELTFLTDTASGEIIREDFCSESTGVGHCFINEKEERPECACSKGFIPVNEYGIPSCKNPCDLEYTVDGITHSMMNCNEKCDVNTISGSPICKKEVVDKDGNKVWKECIEKREITITDPAEVMPWMVHIDDDRYLIPGNCDIPVDAAVVYYAFGGKGFDDVDDMASSKYQDNLKLYGEAARPESNTNKVLYFTGNTAYAKAQNSPDIDISFMNDSNSFAMLFWIKPQGVVGANNFATILERSDQYGLRLIEGNKLQYKILLTGEELAWKDAAIIDPETGATTQEVVLETGKSYVVSFSMSNTAVTIKAIEITTNTTQSVSIVQGGILLAGTSAPLTIGFVNDGTNSDESLTETGLPFIMDEFALYKGNVDVPQKESIVAARIDDGDFVRPNCAPDKKLDANGVCVVDYCYNITCGGEDNGNCVEDTSNPKGYVCSCNQNMVLSSDGLYCKDPNAVVKTGCPWGMAFNDDGICTDDPESQLYSGLTIHYSFDDINSNIIKDLAFKHENGIESNAYAPFTEKPIWMQGISGYGFDFPGHYITFPQTDNYSYDERRDIIYTTDEDQLINEQLTAPEFSINLWFKKSSVEQITDSNLIELVKGPEYGLALVTDQGSISNIMYTLCIDNDSNDELIIHKDADVDPDSEYKYKRIDFNDNYGTCHSDYAFDPVTTTNTNPMGSYVVEGWNMITLVFGVDSSTGRVIKVYLNSNEVGSSIRLLQSIMSMPEGADLRLYLRNGGMDEFMLYRKALTDTEIGKLYANIPCRLSQCGDYGTCLNEKNNPRCYCSDGSFTDPFNNIECHDASGIEDIKINDRLEKCIRDNLKVDENYTLTFEKLASITELYCRGYGITDMKGIEYLINLKILDVSDNNLNNDSVEKMKGNKNLEEVNIEYNCINDREGFGDYVEVTGADTQSGSYCFDEEEDLCNSKQCEAFTKCIMEKVLIEGTVDEYETKATCKATCEGYVCPLRGEKCVVDQETNTQTCKTSCDNIYCGPYEECRIKTVDINGTPKEIAHCACREAYGGENSNSIECRDACAKVRCGKGDCVVVDDIPTCSCDAGYREYSSGSTLTCVKECTPSQYEYGKYCVEGFTQDDKTVDEETGVEHYTSTDRPNESSNVAETFIEDTKQCIDGITDYSNLSFELFVLDNPDATVNDYANVPAELQNLYKCYDEDWLTIAHFPDDIFETYLKSAYPDPINTGDPSAEGTIQPGLDRKLIEASVYSCICRNLIEKRYNELAGEDGKLSDDEIAAHIDDPVIKQYQAANDSAATEDVLAPTTFGSEGVSSHENVETVIESEESEMTISEAVKTSTSFITKHYDRYITVHNEIIKIKEKILVNCPLVKANPALNLDVDQEGCSIYELLVNAADDDERKQALKELDLHILKRKNEIFETLWPTDVMANYNSVDGFVTSCKDYVYQKHGDLIQAADIISIYEDEPFTAMAKIMSLPFFTKWVLDSNYKSHLVPSKMLQELRTIKRMGARNLFWHTLYEAQKIDSDNSNYINVHTTKGLSIFELLGNTPDEYFNNPGWEYNIKELGNPDVDQSMDIRDLVNMHARSSSIFIGHSGRDDGIRERSINVMNLLKQNLKDMLLYRANLENRLKDYHEFVVEYKTNHNGIDIVSYEPNMFANSILMKEYGVTDLSETDMNTQKFLYDRNTHVYMETEDAKILNFKFTHSNLYNTAFDKETQTDESLENGNGQYDNIYIFAENVLKDIDTRIMELFRRASPQYSCVMVREDTSKYTDCDWDPKWFIEQVKLLIDYNTQKVEEAERLKKVANSWIRRGKAQRVNKINNNLINLGDPGSEPDYKQDYQMDDNVFSLGTLVEPEGAEEKIRMGNLLLKKAESLSHVERDYQRCLKFTGDVDVDLNNKALLNQPTFAVPSLGAYLPDNPTKCDPQYIQNYSGETRLEKCKKDIEDKIALTKEVCSSLGETRTMIVPNISTTSLALIDGSGQTVPINGDTFPGIIELLHVRDDLNDDGELLKELVELSSRACWAPNEQYFNAGSCNNINQMIDPVTGYETVLKKVFENPDIPNISGISSDFFKKDYLGKYNFATPKVPAWINLESFFEIYPMWQKVNASKQRLVLKKKKKCASLMTLITVYERKMQQEAEDRLAREASGNMSEFIKVEDGGNINNTATTDVVNRTVQHPSEGKIGGDIEKWFSDYQSFGNKYAGANFSYIFGFGLYNVLIDFDKVKDVLKNGITDMDTWVWHISQEYYKELLLGLGLKEFQVMEHLQRRDPEMHMNIDTIQKTFDQCGVANAVYNLYDKRDKIVEILNDIKDFDVTRLGDILNPTTSVDEMLKLIAQEYFVKTVTDQLFETILAAESQGLVIKNRDYEKFVRDQIERTGYFVDQVSNINNWAFGGDKPSAPNIENKLINIISYLLENNELEDVRLFAFDHGLNCMFNELTSDMFAGGYSCFGGTEGSTCTTGQGTPSGLFDLVSEADFEAIPDGDAALTILREDLSTVILKKQDVIDSQFVIQTVKDAMGFDLYEKINSLKLLDVVQCLADGQKPGGKLYFTEFGINSGVPVDVMMERFPEFSFEIIIDAILSRLKSLVIDELLNKPYAEALAHARAAVEVFKEEVELVNVYYYVTTYDAVRQGIEGIKTPINGENNENILATTSDDMDEKARDKFRESLTKDNPDVYPLEIYEKFYYLDVLMVVEDLKETGLDSLKDIAQSTLVEAINDKLPEGDKISEDRQAVDEYLKNNLQTSDAFGQVSQGTIPSDQNSEITFVDHQFEYNSNFMIGPVPVTVGFGVTFKAGMFYGGNFGAGFEQGFGIGFGLTPYLTSWGFLKAGIGYESDMFSVAVGVKGELEFFTLTLPLTANAMLKPSFEFGSFGAYMFLETSLKPHLTMLSGKLSIFVKGEVCIGLCVSASYNKTLLKFEPLINKEFGNILPLDTIKINLFSLGRTAGDSKEPFDSEIGAQQECPVTTNE